MKRSVLLADDEPAARDYLTRLLNKLDYIEVIGAKKNGQEVLDFCQTLKPDILLLDIEMPGVDGMTAARKLSGKLKKTVIVFITAYDQYAIQAFDQAAVGYLLKPFDEKGLLKVLDRAIEQLNIKDKADFTEQMNALWNQLDRQPTTTIQTFEIKEKGLIQKVRVDDILFVASESEYARLIAKQKDYLQRLSIKTLDQQLPDYFHRIHRSYLINKNHIASWKYANGKFHFTLSNGEKISSSRSYKEKISSWLD